ncbi:hypothetical protein E2562_022542 [Oryza meyeriana var. granulata]|uniref:Uncharacterized protein n=1 Tax=Oryza meyeriana var. granulata TaxID=110450 RepID=A0A6G1FAS7_9ORYZ|nr:hypothetical protein E2562_022542 [Oryza meyeriana var. granulata]
MEREGRGDGGAIPSDLTASRTSERRVTLARSSMSGKSLWDSIGCRCCFASSLSASISFSWGVGLGRLRHHKGEGGDE